MREISGEAMQSRKQLDRNTAPWFLLSQIVLYKMLLPNPTF